MLSCAIVKLSNLLTKRDIFGSPVFDIFLTILQKKEVEILKVKKIQSFANGEPYLTSNSVAKVSRENFPKYRELSNPP